jgi:hypothetical protein
MKRISTKLHSRLDYITGILFIAIPWISDFNEVLPATWTFIAIGAIVLLMSFFTDYEGGIVRSLPIRIHINLDMVTGLFLAASPWILGFDDKVYLPHLVLGLFETAASLMTVRVARGEKESAF